MARVVSTRHVTIVSREGERLKKSMWSRPRYWRKHKDITSNLIKAIAFANNRLAVDHVGTIVYMGDVPVYHCKWGGGRGFSGWKANPVAEYWRKRLSRR